MYAILISIAMFPGQEPQVVAMPFVMSMAECQAQVELEPDTIESEFPVTTTCYPLDREAVENFHFSAGIVLKGLVD